LTVPIDWNSIRRVLVVRLRSIGDTVLSTPSLIALRRYLPDAQIDILLEDWVAPLLDGFDAVDNVIAVGPGLGSRLKTARKIRKNHYDVAFNLHGGTTATFFTFASRARHRVGYSNYSYSILYNHLLSSSADYWQQEHTHSGEQQLALLGFVGVPVEDRPRTRLVVTKEAELSLAQKFRPVKPYALMHPASLFFTKQWAAENFAHVAHFLAQRGIETVAVAAKNERDVLLKLQGAAEAAVKIFDGLTLPEITALGSRATLFVGNDSGIAHIAAAVNTPTVVIFGSSNRNHWYPWTDSPNEIVYHPLPCQPCPGYECKVYGQPKCILSVTSDQVMKAVERVLAAKEKGEPTPAFANSD